MEDLKLLKQIELSRRSLDDMKLEIGVLYDFLDRGYPTSKQQKDTMEKIGEKDNSAASLEKDLVQLVKNIRKKNPTVIANWVDIHQAINREINIYYTNKKKGKDRYRLECFVTSQAIEDWEEVRKGEADFVLSNYYVMEKHRDIIKKHFGF